ncbi:13583_t:CDS:2, partial [Acaulospora colombiana]
AAGTTRTSSVVQASERPTTSRPQAGATVDQPPQETGINDTPDSVPTAPPRPDGTTEGSGNEASGESEMSHLPNGSGVTQGSGITEDHEPTINSVTGSTGSSQNKHIQLSSQAAGIIGATIGVVLLLLIGPEKAATSRRSPYRRPLCLDYQSTLAIDVIDLMGRHFRPFWTGPVSQDWGGSHSQCSSMTALWPKGLLARILAGGSREQFAPMSIMHAPKTGLMAGPGARGSVGITTYLGTLSTVIQNLSFLLSQAVVSRLGEIDVAQTGKTAVACSRKSGVGLQHAFSTLGRQVVEFNEEAFEKELVPPSSMPAAFLKRLVEPLHCVELAELGHATRM